MGQIYIEDYVVSFLKQKKTEAIDSSIRLALFGTAVKPKTLFRSGNETGTDSVHYIYGAAVIDEERTIEDIGDEYFSAYQFLGFVNVSNKDNKSLSQYHIFYDENTAMQDYLIYYYMSPFSAFHHSGRQSPFCEPSEPITTCEGALPDKSLKVVKLKESLKKSKRKFFFISKLKMFVLIILCLITATSITTINDYKKMHDFTQIAEMAVAFTE
ncbi:MAG: hypothetical protein FWC09_06610 [Lachnospiraceae bacterium]|nr:hypothetical protein [Lachnospiraceae bacterium]